MTDECIHGMGDPAWCVLCNGRAAAEAKAAKTDDTVQFQFTARFAGRCALCGEQVEPGDTIGMTADKRIACEDH